MIPCVERSRSEYGFRVFNATGMTHRSSVLKLPSISRTFIVSDFSATVRAGWKIKRHRGFESVLNAVILRTTKQPPPERFIDRF